MSRITCSLILVHLLLFATGCTVFVSANGSKSKQLFPAKDKGNVTDMDTSYFVRKTFQNFTVNTTLGESDKRKIIIPVTGADVQTLINSDQARYVYFSNPGCRATTLDIHNLDSFEKIRKNIIVISLRKSYNSIDKLLKNTAFSQHPYYVIEDKKYSDILLHKKIQFIKEVCPSCYTQYRDYLAVVDYLVVGKGNVSTVFYRDTGNILSNFVPQ